MKKIKEWFLGSQLAQAVVPLVETPAAPIVTAEDIIVAAVIKSMAEEFEKWAPRGVQGREHENYGLLGPMKIVWQVDWYKRVSGPYRLTRGNSMAWSYVNIDKNHPQYEEYEEVASRHQSLVFKDKNIKTEQYVRIATVDGIAISNRHATQIYDAWVKIKAEHKLLDELKAKTIEEEKLLKAQWDLAQKYLKLGEVEVAPHHQPKKEEKARVPRAPKHPLSPVRG